MKPKRPTPSQIIIKMPKVKDKENLKNSREKLLIIYKGVLIRLSPDFSAKNLVRQKGVA